MRVVVQPGAAEGAGGAGGAGGSDGGAGSGGRDAAGAGSTGRESATESPHAGAARPAGSSPRTAKRPRSAARTGHDAFEQALKRRKGLEVVAMRGDGNCLFRAVSAQVLGEAEWHAEVRQRVVAYMRKERAHFAAFVAGDFDAYLGRMRQDGCFGSNPELQAVAELFNRPVQVYECPEEEDAVQAALEPINIFQGAYRAADAPIRLLYRDGNHYDALLDPYEASVGVGLGLAGLEPGKMERDLLEKTRKKSLFDVGPMGKGGNAALGGVDASIMEAVKRESLRDFIEQHESKRRRFAEPSEDDKAAEEGVCGSGAQELTAVRELVCNGFDTERVLEALQVVGDSFNDMLAYLLASEPRAVPAQASSSSSSSSSSSFSSSSSSRGAAGLFAHAGPSFAPVGATSSSSSSSSSSSTAASPRLALGPPATRSDRAASASSSSSSVPAKGAARE